VEAAITYETINCDVVIVGGSVAGLAAAVTSAKEGAITCLLEPTDMTGGQMAANGIPALDFSIENGRVPFNTTQAAPDTMMVNHAHDLTTLLRSLPGPGYRQTCWVSCATAIFSK
jgi:heterodisulfide reductase subunit A-like polyferredoxin